MIQIYCVSPSHKRYENGVFVEQSVVQRYITLDYSLDGKFVEVTIIPTLSTKKAYVVRDSGDTLYYKGIDPDYEFELHTNHNNQVDIMRLKRLDKNLMIEYSCWADNSMRTLKDLNDREKLAVIQCGYQIIMSANGNIISEADNDCIDVILDSVCDNKLQQNALWNDAIWTDPYNSFKILRGLLKDKELRCSFLEMITDLVNMKNNRRRFNCATQVLDFVGYTHQEVIEWAKKLRPITITALGDIH